MLGWVARLATSLLLRRVEVADRDRLPRGRPVVLVANHFNGFVDPMVIIASLGWAPRFIAKGALKKVPLLGPIMRAAGVVFVHRAVDSSDRSENVDAFAECHRALQAGDTVAIFPEGTTHDRPRMDPIKTGAARIALGARAAGAEGIAVVPVGVTYHDKVALRSSALVQFGKPIDLAVAEPDAGSDDVEAVRRLTAVIEHGLRAVSQDFPDLTTAVALEQAAHVALSGPDEPEPSLEAQGDLARALSKASPEDQARVGMTVGRYNTLLAGLRLTDADIVSPTNPTRLLRSSFWIALLVVALGGVVAATAIVNVWPAALVALASLAVKTPVTKGTVRVLVGLIAFPAAWITAAVITTDGFLPVSLLVVTMAIGALAAIWLVERAIALTNMLLRWRAQRERVELIRLASELRAEVAATVREVTRT